MPYRKELFPVRRIAILSSIILLSLMAGTWRSRAAEPGKQWLQQLQSWMLHPGQSRLQHLTTAFPVRSTTADCPLPLFEKISQTSAPGYPPTATGDFNGDGKTDVAVPEAATSRMLLYFGNGDGTLTRAGSFETGTKWDNPPHPLTADFNGDKLTDLLLNGLSNGNRIWLNNGNGTFTAGPALTGSYSGFSVVADFNHDGNQDLASDNFLISGFQIHLSDRKGNLSTLPAQYSLPGAYRMTAADFNGDGELDIAGTTYEPDRVRVFFGNGKGEFTTGQPAAAGLADLLPDYSLAVQAADVNKDGKADLLVDGNGLTVLLNQGTGNFQARTFPEFYALYGVGDFDGDGLPDAFGNEHLALNNGDGTFCIRALPETISRASAKTADFNNDGVTDVMTQSPVDSFSIFLNRHKTSTPNTPPVITDAFAEIRQAVVNTEVVIATVSDAETAAGLLVVTIPDVGAALGNGINGINDLKNTDGRISVKLNTYCVNPSGIENKIRLRVTDAVGLSTERDVTIRILPTLPPSITAPETLTVDSGGEVIFEVMVIATLSFPEIPGFAGDITDVTMASEAPGLRRFKISRASPVGAHLINLRAVDSCGVISTTRQIKLIVTGNVIGAAPGITTVGSVSLRRGEITENIKIAQVSDAETPAGELKVDFSSRFGEASGVNLLSLSNNQGEIFARVSARCEDVAPTNKIQLRVTDSDGNFAVSELIINTSFPPPIVPSTYPREVIYTGIPLTVTPVTPGSNFNRTSIGLTPPGLKATVNAEGVVTLEGNIAPGIYLVTVYFSSVCFSQLSAFTVRVPVPPPVINCESLRFTPQQDYRFSGGPYSVVTGDFNQDGMPDIASANLRGSNVSILLAKMENGTRTFVHTLTIETGREPRFIATGDFNRDGYADLATANYAGNSISILDGLGNGFFYAPRNFPVTGNPFSVNVADFNGDGNQDLLAVTDIGAKVVLLSGDGKGNFEPPVYFNAGALPQPPELVDFDNNGRIDLFVPDYLGKRIGRMWGLGTNAGFSAPSFLDVGFNVTAVAVADFNADGTKDMATLDSDNNSVVLFLSESLRSFEKRITLSAGLYPASITANDFNGDNLMDLAVGNYSESTITVFLGDGKGGFTSSSDHLLEVGSHPLSLISTDLNNDKLPDLVIANSGSDTVSVIYSECGSAAPEAVQPEFAVTSAASYFSQRLAKETIAVAFGSEFTSEIRSAELPLPDRLGNVSVTITDRNNITHSAPLFFVSPTQVNYQIPGGVATGPATVTIHCASGKVMKRRIIVTPVAPGLFTVNASGRGLAAAVLIRVSADGRQRIEPITKPDPATNSLVAIPIEFSADSDELYLALFGTGIRYRRSLEKVSAKIGDLSVPVLYAGAQNDFTGLDQINLKLPRLAALHGEKEIEISVEGFAANRVRVIFR